MKDHSPDIPQRRTWMGLLAKAEPGRVADLLDQAGLRPEFQWLRRPETGSVMVQGRTGGTGAPFNLGEMTVTRCALTLACGTVGHAYIQGRNKADAKAAALVDALMQTGQATEIQTSVLDPLQAEADNRRATRAARAAATKVDFFTLVRGED